tara:strand:+ start:237 stop:542 length:306 start_codon:yes stop_codon:yes gene_type:complete
MEILLTVLITLGVCAIAYSVLGVVRLNRKAEELDTIQMDMQDISDRIDRMIENLEKDLRQNDEELHKDVINRIDGWVASTDRRFDKTWNEFKEITTSKKSY